MAEYNEKIQKFLEQLKKAGVKKIIAFSGSCSKDLEERAEKIVEESFEIFSGLPIAILTGGTNFDVQKYAAERAKKNNMPLIGIYPFRGTKYRLESLDFALEISPRYADSEWGDESEIFAKLPHGAEVIGGGLGTLIEFSHIMKINDGRLRKEKELVYIAPIKFLEKRTAADAIYEFSLKQELRMCLPPLGIIEDGRWAAEFLVDSLKLR